MNILVALAMASFATCVSDGAMCPPVEPAPTAAADPLSLPAPWDAVASSSTATAQSVQSVAIGERKALEHLGPMVLGRDGRSYSRIKNWAAMGAAEQNRTRRVILRRNAARAKKAHTGTV